MEDTELKDWAERANYLISKIYQKMSRIEVNKIGLEESNRRRVHLQKKLNKIGKMASSKGVLRVDDGYEWLRDGSGRLKPRLPLPLR